MSHKKKRLNRSTTHENEAVVKGTERAVLEIIQPRRGGALGFGKATNYDALTRRNTGWSFNCISLKARLLSAGRVRMFTTVQPEESGAMRFLNCPVLTRFQTEKLIERLDPSTQRFVEAKALRDGKSVREIVYHPLLKILDKPNPFLHGHDLWYLTSCDLDLTGNAYWYFGMSGGTLKSIWPLPSYRMKIDPAPGEPVARYLYRTPNGDVPIPVEDILHIRNPNPRDFYGQGLGPMEANVWSVDLLAEYDAYTENMVKSDLIPPWIAEGDENATPGSIKQFYDELHRQRLDAGKGAPLALPAGYKAKPLAVQPNTVVNREEREAQVAQVCASFGVHPAFFSARLNRATLDAAIYSVMAHSIWPRDQQIDGEMNQTIIPLYRATRGQLFLAHDNPVPEDREARTKEWETLSRIGVHSINEIRDMLNLPPIEGGDEHYKQMQDVPISMLATYWEQQLAGNQTPAVDVNTNEERTRRAAQLQACDHDHAVKKNSSTRTGLTLLSRPSPSLPI